MPVTTLAVMIDLLGLSDARVSMSATVNPEKSQNTLQSARALNANAMPAEMASGTRKDTRRRLLVNSAKELAEKKSAGTSGISLKPK
jgi:hypothetical protein